MLKCPSMLLGGRIDFVQVKEKTTKKNPKLCSLIIKKKIERGKKEREKGKKNPW